MEAPASLEIFLPISSLTDQLTTEGGLASADGKAGARMKSLGVLRRVVLRRLSTGATSSREL